MAQQINNAVTYVAHLRDQGVSASDAVDHAVQRFGVDRKIVMRRVNGYVADSAATQAALAEARDYLKKGGLIWTEADEYLQALYEAVTGETV